MKETSHLVTLSLTVDEICDAIFALTRGPQPNATVNHAALMAALRADSDANADPNITWLPENATKDTRGGFFG